MKYLITIYLFLVFQQGFGQSMACGTGDPMIGICLGFMEDARTKIDSVQTLKSKCRLLYLSDSTHFGLVLMNCANDSILLNFGSKGERHSTSVQLIADFMDFAVFEMSSKQFPDATTFLLSVNKNGGSKKVLGRNPYFISLANETIVCGVYGVNEVMVYDFLKDKREVYDLPKDVRYASQILRIDELNSSGFNIWFYNSDGKLIFTRIIRK